MLTRVAQLLNFTIARTKPEDNHALLLNDLHLNPLYYERRIPMLMSGPDYPSLPPLSADLVSPPASRDTPRRKSVQLAYEYTGIDYMPGDDSKDWLAVLELQTTGLRSGPTNRQVTGCAETPQGPRAVILKIRIWLSYDNEHMEKRIEAIKLIPIPQKRGDKGIAEGRFDINDNKHVWVTRASFQPQEWNDCGRKDDKMRQVMCKVEDFTDRLKIYLDPHIILTLFVVLCIIVFVGLCGLVWLSWRAIRSAWMRRRSMTIRPTSRSESSKAVERAPLLNGDEDLEEEEAEQVYG